MKTALQAMLIATGILCVSLSFPTDTVAGGTVPYPGGWTHWYRGHGGVRYPGGAVRWGRWRGGVNFPGGAVRWNRRHGRVNAFGVDIWW